MGWGYKPLGSVPSKTNTMTTEEFVVVKNNQICELNLVFTSEREFCFRHELNAGPKLAMRKKRSPIKFEGPEHPGRKFCVVSLQGLRPTCLLLGQPDF